jgi:curved DNA-binding protein
LEEFFRGASLEVTVNDPGNAGGPESYPLEVPPGTAPGARFRLRREVPGGGTVVVRVRVRPDFRGKVRGSDLKTDLRITAQRAKLGGTEWVASVTGGKQRVQIPAGVSRGEVLRIEGEGLPKPRGGRGDLLVRVMYRPEVTVRRR